VKAWWFVGPAALVVLSTGSAFAGVDRQPPQAALGARTVDVSAIAAGGPVRLGAFSVVDPERLSQVEEKVLRLVSFTPRGEATAPDRFAALLQRERGGSLTTYRDFLRARWREFEAALVRYGMRPNDLSTARAFAIVSGYRAYNSDHLRDVTSGSIFRTLLAVQTAEPQWDAPWSDEHKQEMYATWGLQGAVLNWYLEGALRSGDPAELASVKAHARALLEQLLQRNPDGVRLDNYACAIYPNIDCKTLMRELRADFALR
jgi:hypothetical protein